MQETEYISDLDHLGSSSYSNTKETGILRALRNTHTSIVRDRNDSDKYLTRFGREGARGIDHILFPNDVDAQAMIKSASIDNSLASLYFPSDYKLIKCTYLRHGGNNMEVHFSDKIEKWFKEHINYRLTIHNSTREAQITRNTKSFFRKYRMWRDLTARWQRFISLI